TTERGHKAESNFSKQNRKKSKGQDASVWADVEHEKRDAQREIGLDKSHHDGGGPEGKKRTQRTSDQSEQQAFGQQLPDKTPATGADCQPHRNLFPTPPCTR